MLDVFIKSLLKNIALSGTVYRYYTMRQPQIKVRKVGRRKQTYVSKQIKKKGFHQYLMMMIFYSSLN